MAKAKSYKLQGREWTVKDLAEELGLSTPRVHGLLKEHNEDIKAIFASRGITPKPADKGPKARLFDYKGKQWTVKQLAEEFGLSNVRVNRLIKEHDGDIEKIALSREKSKKTTETKKAPKTEKTDEKTDIAVDDKESKSLELDLEDKVSFEGIEIDQSITDLYIRNPLNLTDIRALASLNNLQKLSLSDCYELTDISALASLKNLEAPNLSDCPKIINRNILKSKKKTEIIFDETEKDEDQLWDEINDENSAHYEKWENLREHISGIGDIEGSRYMEIADENEYNAFYQSYENHPDFGEEYTNFLNKYSVIFNNEDLDREDLAALFFNNDDLSDDFKDYILRQMAP